MQASSHNETRIGLNQVKEQLRRPRPQLKGRQASDEARDEVRALIGPAPSEGHRRDLLIEYLHALNDHYRALFERHIVALAAEMRLSVVEVFEVASFYHHFQILKDDQTAPALTVRVCDSLSCQLAGGDSLLTQLQRDLGAQVQVQVQVLAAPCLGRCEQAPAAQVGQKAVARATAEQVKALVSAQDVAPNALPEALGLHMPLQGTGVQSSPQRPFGQLGARPGERRDPFGDLVTRRQQVLGWHLPRHQADPFGLLGIDVAAGEHDLEGPRGADRPRQKVTQAQFTGGEAVVDTGRPEIGVAGGDPDVGGQREAQAAAEQQQYAPVNVALGVPPRQRA